MSFWFEGEFFIKKNSEEIIRNFPIITGKIACPKRI